MLHTFSQVTPMPPVYSLGRIDPGIPCLPCAPGSGSKLLSCKRSTSPSSMLLSKSVSTDASGLPVFARVKDQKAATRSPGGGGITGSPHISSNNGNNSPVSTSPGSSTSTVRRGPCTVTSNARCMMDTLCNRCFQRMAGVPPVEEHLPGRAVLLETGELPRRSRICFHEGCVSRLRSFRKVQKCLVNLLRRRLPMLHRLLERNIGLSPPTAL